MHYQKLLLIGIHCEYFDEEQNQLRLLPTSVKRCITIINSGIAQKLDRNNQKIGAGRLGKLSPSRICEIKPGMNIWLQ
jgi:hypothetical protein